MKKKTTHPYWPHAITVVLSIVLFVFLFHGCSRKEEPPLVPPTISSIDPDSGMPGTEIKIGGTGFGVDIDKVSVTINGVPAVVKSVTETQIVVIIPEDAGSGPVKITVNGVTVTGPSFTFQDKLIIKDIQPKEGPAGTIVAIIGKGFSAKAADDIVTFNGKIAILKSVKKDTLFAEVPFQAGDGVVGLVVRNQLVTGPFFDFTESTGLTISAVNPSTGVATTEVTIFGSQFGASVAQNIVKFNGVAANVTQATTVQLKANVPAGATSGSVSVEVAGQRVTGPLFTVFGISQVDPAVGTPGTVVTLNGDAFSLVPSGNTVLFNGAVATVTSASARQLLVVVPLGATTGVVAVRVGNLVATGPTFTVSPSAITDISPNRGFPDSDVTINGQGFDTQNAPLVKFNGLAADVKRLSSTEIKVTVPTTATTGYVTVEYSSRLLSGPIFTVIQTNVASIQPSSGLAGTTVTINGTGFNTDLSQVVLKFNGVPAVIQSITETQIIATVPHGAKTGYISVKYGKREIYGPLFTVQQLSLASFEPAGGPAGAMVTLTGTGFDASLAGTLVTFNGALAAVVSATSTEIVVTVPALATTGDLMLEVNGFQINGGTFTVTPTMEVTTLVSGLTAPPLGIAIGRDGNLFVSQGTIHSILSIDGSGQVNTFAGENGSGFVDGAAVAAAFNFPNGVFADATSGDLYVADGNNNAIRQISNGVVSTLAGGTQGQQDGAGSNAQFYFPLGITMAPDGNLYVTDFYNHLIRKITPGGNVTTFAGTGTAGAQNEVGTAASFNGPYGITSDDAGNLYVCDLYNDLVRKITPSGEVTTLVNLARPMGIVADKHGALYVCTDHSRIYEVSTGSAVLIAGSTPGNTNGPPLTASFNTPIALAIDADGNLYVADSNNKSIRKVTLH
ncbi:MAG TPA: IPT/TIG domain-containing protein [Chryseolinea sp.]